MITSRLPAKLIVVLLFVAPAVHAIGDNPDNTWYAVSVYPDSLYQNEATVPTQAFTSYGEAVAAMRQAVPHGDKLTVENTSGRTTYYHTETEDVIPGGDWRYRGHYGGMFSSVDGAIGEFMTVNTYDCKVEDGPLSGWEEGSVWNCYPPSEPSTTEIATYNLRILQDCGNEDSGVDVDPVFCRSRIDRCPEHTPHFVPSYRNSDPNRHGGGEYCYNNTRASITEFTCKCNQTGISRKCKSVATEYLVSADSKGAIHYYMEAVDPQYRPLKCQEYIEIPQDKQCALEGNPVNIATGCKLQDEVDFQGGEGLDLSIKRHYKTSSITSGLDAPKKYDDDLYGKDALLCHTKLPPEETATASSSVRDGNGGWYLYKTRYCPVVVLLKPSGEKVLFAKMNTPPDSTGTWYEASDPRDGRVKYSSYFYYYYDKSGDTYKFYYDRRLRSIERDGKLTRFSYRYNKLEKVTDHYGRELFYTYNENNRIASVRTPDGHLIKYDYDAYGNLIEVIYPDSTPGDDSDNPRKRYLFEDSRFPSALTGIINENGVRYASWEYDEYGRATSSTHNGGIDKYEFEYIDGNTTLVRKYLSETEYQETTKTHGRYGGSDVITSISTSPCADCVVGDISRHFDPETGDLLSKTDEKGNLTTYQYDDEHREILRIEAVGTPQERVIETVWNHTVNKPFQIIEEGQITEFIYDAAGRLISKTERSVD